MHDFLTLDFRVGVVLSSSPAPASNHLNICSVDVGSLGHRQLVQGCNVLPGQRVIVICNVTPAQIRGVWSQGGLLVGYYEDERRVAAAPPKSAPVGASLMQGTAASPPIDIASPDNAWSRCCHRLSVCANGDICFDGTVLEIDGEACRLDSGLGATFR